MIIIGVDLGTLWCRFDIYIFRFKKINMYLNNHNVFIIIGINEASSDPSFQL